MAVRRESVELSMTDAGFSTTAAKAAAVTAMLNRELDKTDGASLRVNRSTTALGSSSGGITKTGQAARSAGSDLDKYSGRLNLIATAATTLGPALLPISAMAVPALTSLAGGLGAAAGAVGTAILAFHGLGDALKALDDYQLDPTDAHLQKLNETFGQLSPAAQDLVSRLDSLEPVLSRLQETAQDDMFPGLNAGLDQVLTLAPEVQDIVGRIATELGRLGASAGESLANDDDWQAFFTYIKQDAEPILDDFARATGNFVAGLGSILVAFRPLSDDFSSGLLDMSRDFREWSANLSDNAGFQDFVDYIRDNGPAVRDFFGALSDAFVGLVKAAAPWGSTMLPILSDLAKVFGVIASSPIGPVLYDTAAAMLVLNRAMAIGGSERVTRLASGFTTLRSQLRTMPADLRAMGSEYENLNRIQSTSLSFMSNTTGAAGRLRGTLTGLGGAAKMAAGAGGFMLLADGMQRTNKTASVLESTLGGAAMGLATGSPWGVAIGGAVGLVTSLGQSNDHTADQVANLAATFDQQTGAITANTRALVAQELEQDGALKAASALGLNMQTVLNAALGDQASKLQLAQQYVVDYNAAFNHGDKAAAGRVDQWSTLNRVIGEQSTNMDSATAAARRQADALGSTGDATQQYGESSAEAATKAQQLATEMQAAREQAKGQAQQWITLGKSIDDTKVSLDGWIHEMALQARALSQFADNAETAANRGLKEGLIKQLEAAGPAGAIRMKQLADGTQSQIARANAAFASGQQAIRAYVAMSIPPKQIRIQMNSDDAMQRLQAIKSEMASIHDKTVRLNYFVNQVNAGNKRAGGGKDGDPSTPYAAGGFIKGPGTGTSDSIPARLSNGEFVMNAAATSRLRPWLEWENSKGYASGGYVQRYASGGEVSVDQLAALYGSSSSSGSSHSSSSSSSSSTSKDAEKQTKKLTKAQREQAAAAKKAAAELKHLQLDLSGLHGHEFKDLRKGLHDLVGKDLKLAGDSLKDLNKASKLVTKSLDSTTSALQAMRSNRDAVSSSITSGLSRDLWSVPDVATASTNVWSASSMATTPTWSPQYAIGQLNAEGADASEFTRLVGVVQSKGITGAALGELLSNGGIDALRAFANAPDAVDRQYQQAYGQATSAVALAAKAGGQATYGKQIDHIQAQVKALRGDVKDVTKAIKDKQKVDDASRAKHAKTAGKEQAKALDKTAKKAKKR